MESNPITYFFEEGTSILAKKAREGWRRGVVFIREIVQNGLLPPLQGCRITKNTFHCRCQSTEEGEERVAIRLDVEKELNSIRVKTVGPPKLGRLVH